ncbi:RES domain-containing protein [Clostridium sp. LIBA-8841]|uniref:RES domain-containing protein n=1 Tax=Clostridium sp. LIBA-8841 TaxID=2987530 RepID=UPI002AC7D66B|nr:RES domain-containing protein [Clostridium sp. LIBA-8841]MDZ5252081.1 RES domain-containing protein [Clostridium sp. LIBA-8841]
MICYRCSEYKFWLNIEKYLVLYNPQEVLKVSRILDDSLEIADEECICDNCGATIVQDECYIDDEENFMDEILEFMGKLVTDEIKCCKECGEGAQIEEIHESIERCYCDKEDNPEEIFDEYDTSTPIEDILNDLFCYDDDFWNQYYEQIVDYVYCPNCLNGSGENYDDKIDYGKFDIYTEVYRESDIDRFNHKFYGDELVEIKNDIHGLANSFSIKELINLKEEYLKNKTFVARNETFAKLERFIQKLFDNRIGYLLTPNRMIFRARTENIGVMLSKDEMWEPPFNITNHGRYNDIGTSVLYCANNIDVLKKEVFLDENKCYNVARIITHKEFNLFPINYIFKGEYSGLIDESLVDESSTYKEQYILSNIVSAICLQVGFDGIVYKSTKDDISIDYALFNNYEKNKDLDIISIEVSNK